jgi:predicted neutral ceramidase superfamily lipid hydrolase
MTEQWPPDRDEFEAAQAAFADGDLETIVQAMRIPDDIPGLLGCSRYQSAEGNSFGKRCHHCENCASDWVLVQAYKDAERSKAHEVSTFFASLEEAEAAFAWYVNHVGECEGITFLGSYVDKENRALADSIIEFEQQYNRPMEGRQ